MDPKVMQAVQELVSQGRWGDAFDFLSQYATQQPSDPALEFQLGLLAFNLGNFARAEKHFRKSLEMQPDNPEAHYQLGLAVLKSGRAAESVPAFKDAINAKPNYVLAVLHLGIALLASGELDSALEQFLTVTKIMPTIGAGHYQAGLTSLMLGRFQDALAHFQRAASVDPTMTDAFVGLGQTYTALQAYDDAVTAFGNAFVLEQDDQNLRKMWAASLMNANRFDDAVRQYQEIINLGGEVGARERAMAYNDWGVCLFRQGRLEEASEKLVHAVDVDLSVIEARVNLGLLQLRLQEYELASETFEKVLQEAPDNLQARLFMAVTMLFSGRGKDALQAIVDLINLRVNGPKPADLDLWAGFAALSQDEIDLAGRSFERVLQSDPKSFLALDGLGCCYANHNEHEKALERFSASLSLKPDFALAHMHAARSLEAVGDAESAKQEYLLAVGYDRDVLLPHKDALNILLQASEFSAVMTKSVKLLEIAPDDVDAMLTLAKALRLDNHPDEALQLLGRVLDKEPDNGGAHVLAGQIFLTQGRLVEADDMFRKASDMQDGDAEALLYYSWGKTLALLGLHELAIEKYQRASEIDPYDGDVYEAWGAVLKFLGRFNEAADVYKRAAE